MKILVCVKAVPDPDHAIEERGMTSAGALEIRADGDVDFAMNRFDAFAVEEAVLIKEAYSNTVVDVVSMGPENAKKAVKRSIGMGADAGIHILSSYAEGCDAAFAASCIARVAERKSYDLILCGVMSEDMMQFAVGPMTAERLGIPWMTSVIKADLDSARRSVYVEQEQEGGAIAMHELTLPALLTLQSGINEPRYPSLSNMLRAGRGIIEVIPADGLCRRSPLCRIAGCAYPEKTRDGLILEGSPAEKAQALLRILKQKALI
jgi:electron transfer flavoprotein beta subunit